MFVRRFEAAVAPGASRAGTVKPTIQTVPVPHRASRDLARGGQLLRLQRACGNGYVQRLVSQGTFRLGQASDPAERDADRAARAAVDSSAPVRRAAAPGPGGPYLDAGTERAIRRARGSGRPLPDQVLRPLERRFGADFGAVRLHTDAEADTLSRSLGAQAFTAGSDIFFRSDGYARGRHVLAHELAHVAQQSGSAQPVVQRYIASVNHGLRDPKGFPKDDYGTYRSLDVALHAGGGGVYKGPNQPDKGGVIDQLAKDSAGIMLGQAEDLYLVGHGSVGQIGRLPPKPVAQAIANITPRDWRGQIFSMNCWAAARPKQGQPALTTLQELLAQSGRNVSVTGPVGRSIRHLDWLREPESPLGLRAVVGELTGDEEKAYKDILTTARVEAGIKTEPEEAYDDALRAKFGEKNIGVDVKAAFATQWGRDFQANVVSKLRTDDRIREAIAARRVQFGGAGLDRRIVQAARDLDRGEQRVITSDRPRLRLPEPEARPVPQPQVPVLRPEAVPQPVQGGHGAPWSWFSLAGVGLIGLAVVGVGIVIYRRR